MGISKRIRFEVFKRDGFRCTYCNQTPPNVVLEIDHIIAKAAGGDDEIVNLTTSCFDCNRGKAEHPITSKISRDDVSNDILLLEERKEQLKQYYELLQEVKNEEWKGVELIDKKLGELTNDKKELTDQGRQDFFKMLRIYQVDDIMDAMEISVNKFGSLTGAAFRYMCAILRNWKRDGKCLG